MTDEERFDAWLQQVAGEYHRPGRVPSDVMWTAIEQGLANASTRRRGLRRPRTWPAYAVAAALLLAIGLGSGYWWAGRARPDPSRQTMTAGLATAGFTGTFDAALQTHMANAEAFLVAYRGGAPAGSDVHVREWARDVLGTTRLMMDASAAVDPARRLLLQDLELVLVQIVQLPDSAPAADRVLIDRSLKREHLLTRLRTSIPAGVFGGS